MIEFVTPGLLTTVQDAGRISYQRFGMPVAGAMDEAALALANVLVGNDIEEAALEVTMSGPTLRFLQANTFAVSGGQFEVFLDGERISNNRAYIACEGSVLRVGNSALGSRLYIAFAGGLGISQIMGSRSTYLKGQVGGLSGKCAQKGDQIGFRGPRVDLPNLPYRFVDEKALVTYSNNPCVRVVMGPQEDHFSEEGLATFLASTYQVTAENDRMGYRLEGTSIEYAAGKDGNIISDGIAFGAVQIPDGKPIIMMADRQTTGGYAKIASVIRVDLPLVAQLRAGDSLRFKKISIDEAQKLYRQRMNYFKQLAYHLNQEEIVERKTYKINIHTKSFHVTVSEKIQ